MQPQHPVSTDIVLIGAGHAHVEVLRRAAMRPMRGVRLTLIAREPHAPYSGMLPGLIRGDYAFDAAHIDCAPLAAAAGARLLIAEATALDLDERRVRVAGRPDVAFDFLSVDVGGQLQVPAGAIAVKPIGRFLEQLATLEARLPDGARLAVVGGGAGGTELALALAHRFGRRVRISLVNRDAEPVNAAPPGARRAIRDALVDAGVETLNGVAAGALEHGRLALSDGSYIEAAAALWATGVVAPEFLAASGLACDAAGCVRVDATLLSVSHAFVFAAGDCASVERNARPKSGVWAVRAGTPLAANLRRAAAGHTLRQWRPQREALAILGTGGARAVAWRNGLSMSGRLVWRWKDAIDRHWMRMYQRLRPMPMPAEQMRCAGCGAKLGPIALQQALAGLVPMERADIPVGLAAADDAAVTLPPAGMAVVQSVDHFRAFIDDPYLFGQIAAAHALSDLHAMGAAPWTALAVAAVPYMRGRRMQDDLAAMMRGALEILTADGCALVGGHSAEGAEAGLGFAVNGLVDPAQAWRKSGLRSGDALVLTKPLGAGIVLAGAMRGLAKARWLQATTDSMRRTNAAAAHILRHHGVIACTDVTGFGLGGHLREMLVASRVSAILDPAALKLLPGARELAAQGVESSLAPDNRAALDLPDDPVLPFVIDPQTSGGLLAGVAADKATASLAALLAAGIEAAMIGRVEPAADPLIRFEPGASPCAHTALPPSPPTASAPR
jgi:selenide,water dikinase